MWAGILAYLDRCGYDYVTGCVSVPVRGADDESARQPDPRRARLRAATPRRPRASTPCARTGRSTIDGKGLDDIEPPARVAVPPLMRGLPAARCPGVRRTRPRPRLRGRRLPGAAGQAPGRHPLPETAAVGGGGGGDGRRDGVVTSRRIPGCRGRPATSSCIRDRQPMRRAARRRRAGVSRCARRARCCCCRQCPCWPSRCRAAHTSSAATAGLMLRCLGVRITVSGGPIRNLRGVLVVSGHVSWVDIFAIGAVMPGSFVARADLIDWPALGVLARIMKVIPIDRASLRRLPDVVGAVAERLRAGHTVVAFPEGTTWCGLAYGPFRPAMFQAAIDAGRPVQPLRLSYHHRDGSPSTVAAYIGDDTLLASIRRLVTARRTIVHVQVQSLQLPGDHRRDLAARCEAAVRGDKSRMRGARARTGGLSGFGRPTLGAYPGAVMTSARDGLPGSRRDHPDASCCHRGDDRCAGDGGQRIVAAWHRPGRPPPDGGGARDAGQTPRRTALGSDLHRGRHRERQPRGQGHLLGAARRRSPAQAHHNHTHRASRGARLRWFGSPSTKAPR